MEDNTSRMNQKPNADRPQGNNQNNSKGSNGGHNHHKHQKPKNPNATAGTGATETVQNGAIGSGNHNRRSDWNRRNRRNNRRPTEGGNPAIPTDNALDTVEEVSVVTGTSDAVLQAAEEQDREDGASVLDEIIEAEQRQREWLTADIPDVIPEGKAVIIGVRFRTSGKTYYFSPGNVRCKVGQPVVVETARGVEFGTISLSNRMIDEKLLVSPLRPIIRVATEEDVRHHEENGKKEAEAYRVGLERINAHKLPMKLVSAQYTFDNSKLLFYFTSDGRVDFRELVKDLAGVFHIRIELRQIGIRDETRMIGGLGACGRPLCCTTFLSDFGQVSMKMAKEQNLSLNSTKISGCCGRLMCCLRFEYDTYAEAIKKLPSPGTLVETPDGAGVVTDIIPLANKVKVSLREHPEASPKQYERDDIRVIGGHAPAGDRRGAASHGQKNTGSQPNADKPEGVPAETEVSEPDSDI